MKKFRAMNEMSVAQAAELAGVGKSTIRRAIKKGELLATVVEGPNGEQFSVSASSFREWMESRGVAGEPLMGEAGTALVGAPPVHQPSQAWEAVMESQQTVQQALTALEKAQAENLKMVHQVMHLQNELNSQKLLLTTSAESLRGREEKFEDQIREKGDELEKLERHNTEQKERFEKERLEMLDKLKLAETTVQGFERVPKWVRKMFGT